MRTNERGSVVGYVLGAVVLLALLIGGITLYKNIAGKTGNTTDNQVATQNTSNDDKAAQNEAALKKQQEEAEKKAQEQNQAASNGDKTATEVPHTSTAPAENLPTTGPENVLATAAGAAVLVGAGVAYIRSRSAL